jgi:hypothetical protein
MRIFLTVVTATMLLGSFHLVVGQARPGNKDDIQQDTRDVQERPQQGIEYSRAAKLKLASRKTSYRVGEMINLDIAILNTTNKQIFFHKLSGPQITLRVFDEKGSAVSVTPSIIALEGVVPQSYSLLGPGEIIVGSIQMLAGCNVEGASAFDEARQKLAEDVRRNQAKYDEAVFERNLFINWGDACLRIPRPGTYNVVVEVTNQHVIVSAREPNVKTAVGTTRSIPITITISE